MARSPAHLQKTAAAWLARRDAGLSPCEAQELQAWLAADPRHRAALERCESTWGALDRPYHSGSAQDLVTAVAMRVRRRRQRFRVAAASLVTLLALGFTWRTTTVLSPTPTVATGTATVILPSQRTLPDGSRVELNGDAAIAIDFDGPFRRVVLQRGEAHFQVAKDPARPFVVEVDTVEVRAVGTAFSVQRSPEKVEVLVTEGRVAVNQHADPRTHFPAPASPSATPEPRVDPPRALATLDAGHRTQVSLAPGEPTRAEIETLSVADLSERLAWRAPRLEFTGTPLVEAVALLNEQSARMALPGQPAPRYVVGDPAIAAVRLSGLFRVDSSDAFVRLLKNGFGIKALVREGTTEIVLRKAH